MYRAPSIPSLDSILTSSSHQNSPLAVALSILLEPTPVLFDVLVPQLTSRLITTPVLATYTDLIDQAFEIIDTWDDTLRAQFVHGHPRIGEQHITSTLSAQEQGVYNASAAESGTSIDVLQRLKFLNKCYEKRYPGLVYVTFVNGRTKAQIRDELEMKLETEGVVTISEEDIGKIEAEDKQGKKWKDELGRAISDISRIAKSRLKTLGVS